MSHRTAPAAQPIAALFVLLALLSSCGNTAPAAALPTPLPSVTPLAARGAPPKATSGALTGNALPAATATAAQGGSLADRLSGRTSIAATVATPAATTLPAAPAAPTDAGVVADAALAARADAYLNQKVADGSFAGSVLVSRDGKVLFARGYGQADTEHGFANTTATHFRVGSITKQFTAVAIMLLQRAGKLRVTDSVCQYLPGCPPAWQPISIRNLLTHTSGLPNYTDFANFEETEPNPTTEDELISRFRDLPLVFAPGELYSYCNSNYVVLGALISRVSGVPYPEFLKSQIFEPLNLRDTDYDHGMLAPEIRALGYYSPGELAPPHDMSTLDAAGALYSTVGDLFAWEEALYTNQLLRPTELTELTTPYRNNYAYGLKLQTINDAQVIGHPGLVTGFSAYVGRYPAARVTVVVLSNLQIAPAEPIANTLAGFVLGR